MQLAFDAADRLVELVHARRGPVTAAEAAEVLFALERAPEALARSLLADVVDGDARLAWLGPRVGLAGDPHAETPIESAELVVFDLETTGLSASRNRICEIGAVRIRGLELEDTFETLVDPRTLLPPPIAALTGIRAEELRRAPRAEIAVRRFLAFTGDAPLAAHNARFDVAFLDREVERLTGQRVASPVVDTVWLARRLLAHRSERFSLARLAHYFGTSSQPSHRALPDALATAEILVALLGLAQERGARTLADVVALAAPRARRLHAKRMLVAGAPASPGVYLFGDRNGAVLYVGKARDLRARLRSYFAGGRQRPAVEAALGALERVEWLPLGSELEASLEELRLIRELRPPANARGTHPDRAVYLERRSDRWALGSTPTRFGPIASKRRAQLAARALDHHEGEDLAAALPPLRAKLRRLARDLRFEDAARLRDRIEALEQVVERVGELERLRRSRICLLAPAREHGFRRAFFVAGGRVWARTLAAGPAGRLEVEAGLAEAARLEPSYTREDAEELLVVSGFLRRPPPELRVLSLDASEILAA
ncbi:MAG TPA: exonuclease domain-containing protein [Gaiellaceae bacterium]|nr:exonuclease domain-containing protein [Gaiellaceae bacterium]